MQAWSHHMPRGMHLKSEGFASNLYEPAGKFTLEAYCTEHAVPYGHIGVPVPIETFIAYGREFQRRFVPEVEDLTITSLRKAPEDFELTTSAGHLVRARRVVVATGIVSFAYVPPLLATIPGDKVSHSSQHSDLSDFKGRKVAVLGAGSSALDIAALLLGAGATVELVARTPKVEFHNPPNEPRPFLQRLKAPRSGLGIGWRSRMCSEMPLVFHAMPRSLRIKAVERHLGPSACWFVRDAVADRLPMHLGVTLAGAYEENGRAGLVLSRPGGENRKLEVDHIIAATGYKTAVARLKFIDESVQSRLLKTGDAPTLNRHFESSVPGLYFVGVAAANSFGPLLRFAYGARFAAERLGARLANG